MSTPLRVLIVEDSEDDALLMVRELQRGGYGPTFERVETPEAMKASLEKQSWDLIIADYTLPRFSGLAALEMLKESGLDLPFIIVSGTIGEDAAVGAMKAGAHDYIIKNNLTRLVPAIGRELRDALTRQERKKAEEALKDSEEKYRTLVDHSLQGVVVAQGPSPRLVFVNPAMSRILGYTTDELLSRSSKELEILVHPEDREFFFKNFRDRLQGKEVPQNYEVRGIRKDRSVCWLVVSSNRIEYKGKPAVQAAFIDITERKEAEKAFKESERLSWAVLETAPSLIVLTDPEGHILLFNRACEELTGYKREEVIGKTIPELFLPPEWIPIVQKRFADPYAPEVRVPHENPWRTKSGEERLIEWRCTVLPSPVDGSPHILGTGIDITERKKAEEAVNTLLARQEALLAAVPDIIMEVDHNKMYTWANQAGFEFFGEDVIGKEAAQYFEGEQDTYGVVQPLFEGDENVFYVESWQRRRDGQKRLLGWWCRVLKDDSGNVTGAFSSAQDITERKRAEQALRQSEERFKELFDNAPVGYFEYDSQGRITNVNHTELEILGYTAEEMIGQPVWKFVVEDEDARQKAMAKLAGVLPPARNLERTYRRKDGTTLPVLIEDRLLRDSNGRIASIRTTIQDITERKRAEEALKESEERYKDLFENAIDGIALADAETGILIDCNKAIENLVNRERAELIGQSQKILHPPEDNIGEVSRSFARHRFDKKGQLLETQVITKAGERKHVEIKANIIELKGGRVLQGIFRDITERKEAEEAVKESEKRYRGLFDGMPIGLYRTNSTGEILDVNPALVEMLGYPDRESLSKVKAVDTDADPEERKRWLTLMEQHGIVHGFQRQLRRRDGSVIWVEENTRVFRDAESGGLSHYEGSFQDITERKQAEEALQRSEDEARQLAQENAVMAEVARIISSTLNIDEVYQRFAEEVRKVIPLDRISVNIINPDRISVTITYSFGVRIGDDEERLSLPLDGPFFEYILNRRSGFLIHPQDENELAERYPNLVRHFRAGIRTMMSVPLISKDQVIGILHIQSLKPNAYMESNLRLAERVGNQIAGAIANAQLFTESLRAEEEKAALQEQLRQSQKMEAIGRLAGGVAHDFNNLLTIIKGNSELTLIDMGKDDPLRENLEAVLRASSRASDLIRQLLAFSRRQILEMKVLDLNSLLIDLDKMLHRLIGEDIELVTLPSKDLGRVKADAGQIEQVILNLAVNSRDAMPSGGRLTIETANVELDEEYARRHVAVIPGRYVMLSVSDTGAGMTPEVRDRVFEPFFTTKETSKGTGLGLSTVYGIVKQSGGNIWVYSEPGKGATFKIYLPRVDEPLGEMVREKAEEGGIPRGSETVLIVEDDDDVREVAVQILKTQGYRVLETSNGSDAFRCGEQEAGPIHLMVTDVVMPGMNGPELAKRLIPLRPEMKVLYISGYTDNAIVHHGVLEKGVNYIQKPFTVEGLARKVRDVLDQ